MCENCGGSSHCAFIQPWHDNKFVAQCQAAKAWNNRKIDIKNSTNSDDFALIEELSRRNLQREDVYVFSIRLCDNEIDRDFERFTVQTLEQLASLFVGRTGILDHQLSAKNHTARIYKTEIIRESGRLTQAGDEYCWLKGYAYMQRTDKNRELIDDIDGGIKKEISVGCSIKRRVCSICGNDLGCGHKKGQYYDGKLCYTNLEGSTDVYEWSFVVNPHIVTVNEQTDFMKCKICNGTGFVGIGPGIRGIKKCESCNGTGRAQGYVKVPHPVVDVLIPVDSEMLKWLDMKQFPADSQELVDAIKEAVYLAYKRV